jgi:hypothetical protein
MCTQRFVRYAAPCTGIAKRQHGIALFMVLLILLVITAIGMGLLFMADTETSVNANYKDTQVAFFAMRSGLEEVRDRMRSNSVSPLTLPTTMPGSANSVLYLINPAASTDTVAPTTTGNPYFDDEFCHETFSGLLLSNPGVGVPCTVAAPSSSVAAFVNSFSPNTNTPSALKYKWVRVTLKQNGTLANGVANAMVDSTQPSSTQICYQTLNNQEVPLSLVGGGPYANCAAAQSAGQDASPVYIATSLAITPQGTRRIGQYEVAGFTFSPPGGALGLDGPGATFSPRPSSANFAVNGTDSGAAGYTSSGGTGSCTPSGPAQVPAISTGDAAGTSGIKTSLTTNPNRSGNYTGAGGTPSVVNEGSNGGTYTGAWSSPAQLDALVNSIANVADVTYTCGIGSPCSPSGSVGTNAAPQITYVSGDFNYGNSSGAGVLVVTGTLTISGNASFNGLILVIGQGQVNSSGGGNGGYNGSIFIAQTHSTTSPYPELSALGSPAITFNGGGGSGIQYNSCWADIGNTMDYNVIATREEMY